MGSKQGDVHAMALALLDGNKALVQVGELFVFNVYFVIAGDEAKGREGERRRGRNG